jgi:hypothetical protein
MHETEKDIAQTFASTPRESGLISRRQASGPEDLEEPITYDLGLWGQPSRTYYPDVARFTEIVLARAEVNLVPIAREFSDYIAAHALEDLRSIEEYTFELLNLGTLWRRYGATALAVNIAPFRTFAALSE